jgi:hypothetical protein
MKRRSACGASGSLTRRSRGRQLEIARVLGGKYYWLFSLDYALGEDPLDVLNQPVVLGRSRAILIATV